MHLNLPPFLSAWRDEHFPYHTHFLSLSPLQELHLWAEKEKPRPEVTSAQQAEQYPDQRHVSLRVSPPLSKSPGTVPNMFIKD